MLQAIDILEFSLGFDHPETGEAYSKMGLASQEGADYKSASLWLRRAFCVFFKSFGPHDEITLNSYKHMQNIDTNLDNRDLEGIPYEDLPAAILQIESQRHQLQQQIT